MQKEKEQKLKKTVKTYYLHERYQFRRRRRGSKSGGAEELLSFQEWDRRRSGGGDNFDGEYDSGVVWYQTQLFLFCVQTFFLFCQKN